MLLRIPRFGVILFNANLLIWTHESHSILISFRSCHFWPESKESTLTFNHVNCCIDYKEDDHMFFFSRGDVFESESSCFDGKQQGWSTKACESYRETMKAPKRLDILKSVGGYLNLEEGGWQGFTEAWSTWGRTWRKWGSVDEEDSSGPVHREDWPGCTKQKVKVKSLSHVRLFATPWTVAY